jgi:quinol monooxygenase YgiN
MAQRSMFVKLVFQPGRRDEAIEVLSTMIPLVAGEPGTLVYSFHTDDADEDVVWVFELYADADALATHGGSDAIKDMFGRIGGLFAEAPTMVMATPTASSKGLPS